MHSRKCRIVEFYAGFILHLHLMMEEHVDAGDETSAKGGSELSSRQNPTLQVLEGAQLPEGALPMSVLPTIHLGIYTM